MGYDTEYVGWFLNRRELIASIEGHGLRLTREFLVDQCPDVPDAPEQAFYRGFLFVRTNSESGESGAQ